MTHPASQRAREAAASVVGFHGRAIGVDAEMRNGNRDDHPLVQAFAQFEAETLERAADKAAEYRNARLNAYLHAKERGKKQEARDFESMAIEGLHIATAIRAMLGDPQ